MKIAAVVVTYNRLALLQCVLDAFDNQTRLPDYLIVVDNASTDGTAEYLDNWQSKHLGTQEKIVLHQKNNEGGSGGFYAGTARALQTDADWVWVSDDDAVPALDIFEKAEKHVRELPSNVTVSAICAKIITDGKIAESNRSRRKMGLFRMRLEHVAPCEYKSPYFPCDNFSYVGVLMNAQILKNTGLIRKEYFIWRDDVEHSWRLSEAGKIYCYPDMVVDHRITKNDYNGISWKTYYAYRNDMLMFREHNKPLYFYFKAATAYIKSLGEKNAKSKKLYLDSIKAAKAMEKGLNPEYAPGMKF